MINRQNEENILKKLSPEEESTIVGGYGYSRGRWGGWRHRRWGGWRGRRRWWGHHGHHRGGHHHGYDHYYH
ncbi:MAG: hypothetical protein QNJ47_09335 [Nostocaceae cyanobacterium]|nr:hypothetical protein [Nostocaceae cyanobacterium]